MGYIAWVPQDCIKCCCVVTPVLALLDSFWLALYMHIVTLLPKTFLCVDPPGECGQGCSSVPGGPDFLHSSRGWQVSAGPVHGAAQGLGQSEWEGQPLVIVLVHGTEEDSDIVAEMSVSAHSILTSEVCLRSRIRTSV